MPQPYKNDFYNLLQKKKSEGYLFFNERSVIIDDQPFVYLECNIDLEILECAVNLAKEKSKYTMAQNQAAIARDRITKIQKCAQGVLAEMFIHILLIERYGLNVLRYDLERATFQYKTEEYDIKIVTSDGEYEVESRSSNIHHTDVCRFINEDIIIGPYGNRVKITDELADFHFRPVYMPDFAPFVYSNGQYYYSQNLINGDIKLVITGVATKQDFIDYSYSKSLGQKGTTYSVVDVKIASDVMAMDSKITNL